MSIFYIAILLLSALVFSKILERFKFPEVTAYLIAGVVIGPCVLGFIPHEGLESISIVSQVALAIIAFSIGSSMEVDTLKSLGAKIFVITIIQAVAAFFFVLLGLIFFFHCDFYLALVLASIATATAPAATLLVIQQYNAKGKLVDLLIPIVALDDAVCIIIFGIASSMAKTFLEGLPINLITILKGPVLEIVLSLAIGAAVGFVFTFIVKFLKRNSEISGFTFAVILILSYLARKFHLSDLLTIMACSFIVTNFSKKTETVNMEVDKLAPIIFTCFFVFSGAELDLKVLTVVGAMGVFYIIARALGKYFGTYFSCRIMKEDREVSKYLGLTLLPQAGVAIGLSQIAVNILPTQQGTEIQTIVLGATIIYEMLGPILAKYALKKTHCIAQDA